MELDRRTWRSARRDTQRPRGRGAGRPDTQQRLDRWTTTGVQSNCPDLRKPRTPGTKDPHEPERTRLKGRGQGVHRAHPRTGGEEGPGGGQRQESWCAERLPGRPEAAGHGGRRGVPST